MPKQNRPIVRDGRLQAPKKRTENRSYLTPRGAAASAEPAVTEAEAPADADLVEDPAALAAAEEEVADDPEVALLADGAEAMPPVEPPRRSYVPAPPRASPNAPRSTARVPAAVRAMQQQGVRKRRDVDLDALAHRDTAYAWHELRRIAVLATLVVVTLIVLGVVLR